MWATSEKTKKMSIATSMITRRMVKRYYLLWWSKIFCQMLTIFIAVKHLWEVVAAVGLHLYCSLLGEWEVPMYLLYVAMVVPWPTVTAIRIAVVVVVLQELPVVAACNSRAQCSGYKKLTLLHGDFVTWWLCYQLPDCNFTLLGVLMFVTAMLHLQLPFLPSSLSSCNRPCSISPPAKYFEMLGRRAKFLRPPPWRTPN